MPETAHRDDEAGKLPLLEPFLYPPLGLGQISAGECQDEGGKGDQHQRQAPARLEVQEAETELTDEARAQRTDDDPERLAGALQPVGARP